MKPSRAQLLDVDLGLSIIDFIFIIDLLVSIIEFGLARASQGKLEEVPCVGFIFPSSSIDPHTPNVEHKDYLIMIIGINGIGLTPSILGPLLKYFLFNLSRFDVRYGKRGS